MMDSEDMNSSITKSARIVIEYKDEDDISGSLDQEALNLQKLKQRIEERRRANLSRKASSKTEIILQQKEEPQQEIVSKITKSEESTSESLSSSKHLGEEKVTPKNKETEDKKPATEFKVLGINEFEKKITVKRVLPYWLSHPLSVSTSLQDLSARVEDNAWLHQTLKQTLQAEGIVHLFPVQNAVVPYILKAHESSGPFWPNDVCISAPTGSGKTLAFVLPIVQVLMQQLGTEVRALVVVPVQELAQQVARVFRKYCTNTGLRVALFSAAVPLSQEQRQLVRYTETRGWVSEVDIIVCTAGRLVEHLRGTEGFCLRRLRFLVIDEADRIMDNIQNDWLYHLDRHIKLDSELMTGKAPMLSWNNLIMQRSPPHKLLFSATLSQDPEKLEQWSLFQPKLFSAGHDREGTNDDEDAIRKYTTPDELTEQCIICEAEQKPLILYYLLAEERWNRVLCFANAAQSAHRLAALLNNMGRGQLKVAEISASLDRHSREAVLKKFHAGEINVLISTDALARGIDVPLCDYVISYDPPKNIKTYVHRVGRTGRAGRKGCGVTMLLHTQTALFKTLLNSGGKTSLPKIEIPDNIYDDYAEKYESAIHDTKNQIHTEINTRVKKSIALKRGFKSTENRKRKNSDKEHFNKSKKLRKSTNKD